LKEKSAKRNVDFGDAEQEKQRAEHLEEQAGHLDWSWQLLPFEKSQKRNLPRMQWTPEEEICRD